MKAYLDNNATTRMAPGVLDEMMPLLTERYGNPSSFHSFGGGLMDLIQDAREQVARLIGAEPEEIVFNSGGTEGDNTALFGAAALNPLKPGVVTTSVEHPAVMAAAERLDQEGHPVSKCRVDPRGRPDLEDLAGLIDERTGIVSVMTANNETGVIMPVKRAAELAHDAGALFHTDAVQAAGKIPVDVKEMDADLMSISAHKIHGPKGIGALYIRNGLDLPPMVVGGHQENGRRAGTYNTAGIVGFGKAARLALENLAEEGDSTAGLLQRLESGILKSCPGSRIVGAGSERLPNTATVLFKGVESEAILTLLDYQGVCASSGSACSTGSAGPSHVLTSMGIDVMDANTAIRFSISRYTTQAEIEYVLEVLPPIVEKLRAISPYA